MSDTPEATKGGWELALDGLEEALEAIGGLLEARGAEVDVDPEGQLYARFDGAPDLILIDALGAWLDGFGLVGVELRTRAIACDGCGGTWQDGWKAVFHGARLSERLWVRPVWEPTVPGRIEVIIDPTRAFGGGFHPTTAACMAELDKALATVATCGSTHRPTVLDVGTGTGILAIAAAHLGAEVVGVEIDATACVDAERNAELNGVSAHVRVRHGSMELLEAAGEGLPRVYDVVVANVLAPILVRLAAPIIAATGTAVILSGIMVEREGDVLAAYPQFRVVTRIEDRGWVTLHLAR